jgi:membrane protein DedA with SNARE-associated domain
MTAAITTWGLPVIYLGALAEGEVSLVGAGVVIHLGLVPLAHASTAGFLGLLTSDLGWFLAGRFAGERLRRLRAYRTAEGLVVRLAGRAGPLQILIARGVYGTRVASMLFWGAHGLSLRAFLLLDGIACVAWTAVFLGLGYACSNSAVAIVGEVTAVEHWLLGALVVGGAAVLAHRWVAGRYNRRAGSDATAARDQQ